jgi:hypothetical protein
MRDTQNPIGRVLGELLTARGIADPKNLISRISVEQARAAAESLLIKEATDTDDFRLAAHPLIFAIEDALDVTGEERKRILSAYCMGEYRPA